MPESSVSLAPAAMDVLMPLLFFYGDGHQAPPVQFVSGDQLPETDRYLLVHESDMTPRLAAFHNTEIDLKVLRKDEGGDVLARAVVLLRREDRKPVEFGAIVIHLDGFPPDLRQRITDCREPLGGILLSAGHPHTSHPRAYFQVKVDPVVAALMGLPEGACLSGRCNELRHADGSILADIVEILPPGEATAPPSAPLPS
jgi:hypothetical protein